MTSKSLRNGALALYLLMAGCVVQMPHAQPHPNAELAIFVHVFEGDPADDVKIPGATVTIDVGNQPPQTTDGAGNSLFRFSIVNDRNDTVGYVVRVTASATGFAANSIAVTAFHNQTIDAVVSLKATRPPIVPIHRDGNRFVTPEGKEWKWKGTTDFLLYAKYLQGGEVAIKPLVQQRVTAGANLVRVFSMCANIARFTPQDTSAYYDRLVPFVRSLASQGLYVEFTVFADAMIVMPNSAEQVAHWQAFSRIVNEPNVFLELVNENSHPGNTINTDIFARLDGSALQAHGSEQTDMHPVEPAWDYVAYHARRDAPPDARGATNYDASEFEARYPKERPEIADEGMKVLDVGYAALMGKHANIHNGGTFHSQSGVTSSLWTDAELAAAKAFYAEIK